MGKLSLYIREPGEYRVGPEYDEVLLSCDNVFLKLTKQVVVRYPVSENIDYSSITFDREYLVYVTDCNPARLPKFTGVYYRIDSTPGLIMDVRPCDVEEAKSYYAEFASEGAQGQIVSFGNSFICID